MLHGDARRTGVDDEGGDAAPVAFGLGHHRHDDEQVGDGSVGGPQLAAVDDVARAVLGGDGGGGHAGRVGADVVLGEEEGADVGPGHQREELALLLLGAEQTQRLGHADRLVGGQQGGDGPDSTRR